MTERNTVVLVDEKDNTIKTSDKMYAHENGLLHRAFSVMLYRYKNNKLEFLLQKRAQSKYHCPGLWTNTCCSHPQISENIIDSALLRLKEELVDVDSNKINLENIGSFIYKANFPNGLIEHEFDHVFIAEYKSTPENFNIKEIEELKWVDIDLIKSDYKKNQDEYTAWFYQVFTMCCKNIL